MRKERQRGGRKQEGEMLVHPGLGVRVSPSLPSQGTARELGKMWERVAKRSGHRFSPPTTKVPSAGAPGPLGEGQGSHSSGSGIQALPLPSAWTEPLGCQWCHHQTPDGHQ